MDGNIHPNLGSLFPCSVCIGNVTWWGRSVQCCTYYKSNHLSYSLLQVQCYRQLSLLELSSLLHFYFSWRSLQQCNFLFGFYNLYTSIVKPGPFWPSLRQCSAPASHEHSSLLPPTLYVLSLCTLPTPLCMRIFFCTSCFLFSP